MGFLTTPNAVGRSVAVKLPVTFQETNETDGIVHISYDTANVKTNRLKATLIARVMAYFILAASANASLASVNAASELSQVQSLSLANSSSLQMASTMEQLSTGLTVQDSANGTLSLQQNTTQNRLSTGLKIQSASDNPSGLQPAANQNHLLIGIRVQDSGNQEVLSLLQGGSVNQLSTGQKIQSASDNPAGLLQVANQNQLSTGLRVQDSGNQEVLSLLQGGSVNQLSTGQKIQSASDNASSLQQNTTQSRLSTGLKIQSASDDAAGLQLANQSMESAAAFRQSVLPSLTKFIQAALPQPQSTISSLVEIDPNKLVLATSTAVQACLLSKGAPNQSIGLSAGTSDNNPQNMWNAVAASSSKLLLPGDLVNLGTYKQGTKLDFFLLANSQSAAFANSEAASINPDGFRQHLMAATTKIFAVPQLNSPYVFLSFENLWGGGNQEANNTIIAFNVGAATVKSLLATPEPATWLTLGSFLAVAVWAKRRMNQASLVSA